MHITTAYERREALSDNDLARLQSALMDEVERYKDAIRGYDAEKMRLRGAPFLHKLQERVDLVTALLTQRQANAR
jgi:hypothetical protein